MVPSFDVSHHWQETEERLKNTTDGLGMPIDAGIFEIVVALNAMGIETQQSCQGHLDRALPHPWITFVTQEARNRARQAAQAHEKAREESEGKSHEELRQLFAPSHQLRHEAQTLHAVDQRKVLEYLAAFYASRVVPFDVRLIVYPRSPALSCLENQGACTMRGLSREIQETKLLAYQQEMSAFAQFLKSFSCTS